MYSLAMILAVVFGPFFGVGSEPESAELLFAGDAMMHQAQIDAARRSGATYDYSECFAAVTPAVSSADYAVVNLETPCAGGRYSGYPCFNAPASYPEALAKAGFDLMLTANNHCLDRRDKGLKATIRCLDSLQIVHTGTFLNPAERNRQVPLIRNIRGFRVAFLNYTYGTNGIRLTTDAVVDYIDRDRISRDIENARLCGAEIVCVCPHWGEEYSLLPSASQKALAAYMVDCGADLVIGSHPHVIQPMEMRRRPDGSKALVVYSLGNFISNMKTRDTRGGAVVRVHLVRDPEGHACVDTAAYALVFTVPAGGGHNFRLVPAQPDSVPAQWQTHCREFVRSATAIFSRYNTAVPSDSTLFQPRRHPSLQPLPPLKPQNPLPLLKPLIP